MNLAGGLRSGERNFFSPEFFRCLLALQVGWLATELSLLSFSPDSRPSFEAHTDGDGGGGIGHENPMVPRLAETARGLALEFAHVRALKAIVKPPMSK